MPYSLHFVVSIFSGLRTYIATLPRVLPVRLDSSSVKPSRDGGAAPSAIHVSCRQNTSISSSSSSSSSIQVYPSISKKSLMVTHPSKIITTCKRSPLIACIRLQRWSTESSKKMYDNRGGMHQHIKSTHGILCLLINPHPWSVVEYTMSTIADINTRKR